ncbi:MAG TPA: DUF805 domain-containing protein [Aestuariivirgaceae bacterium]|nr:DUF805 domain-containing protein [Aestuariivirgaceae bacterium]
MDFRYLYTSFEGRINRKPFWIASLIMMAAAIVLSLVIVTPITLMSPGLGVFVALLIWLALLYPVVALGVKRLHDRGKSGQLMAVFLAPSIIVQLGEVLGITGSEQVIGGETIYLPNMLGWLLIAVSLGVAIWALVELGILKGTTGPNAYGPDPLAGTAAQPVTG